MDSLSYRHETPERIEAPQHNHQPIGDISGQSLILIWSLRPLTPSYHAKTEASGERSRKNPSAAHLDEPVRCQPDEGHLPELSASFSNPLAPITLYPPSWFSGLKPS